METVLVTVRTPYETRDFELAAEAPVGEIALALAAACNVAMSAHTSVGASAWMLSSEDGVPLPAANTLAECGIVDGMRLALLDTPTWRMLTPAPPDWR